jgi:hypothetical protein
MAIGTGAKSGSGAADPVLTHAIEHDKVRSLDQNGII